MPIDEGSDEHDGFVIITADSAAPSRPLRVVQG
jgi:hypothetical protein